MTSFLFIVSKKTLAASLSESRIGSLFMFRILAFDEGKIARLTENTPSYAAAVLTGLCFAVLSVSVSPVFLIKLLLMLFLVFTTLKSPENGVLLLFASIPFIRYRVLYDWILLILASYFFKVIRNKRLLKFELFDLCLLPFGLCVLLAGIFSPEPSLSLPHGAALLLVMMLGYVVKSCFCTSALVRSLLYSVIVSGTVVSVIRIGAYVSLLTAKFLFEGMVSVVFNELSALLSSDFSSFLLILPALALALLRIYAVLESDGLRKLSLPLTALLLMTASVLTFNLYVYVFILLCAVLSLIVERPRSVILVILAAAALAVSFKVFPSFCERVLRILEEKVGAGEYLSRIRTDSVLMNESLSNFWYSGIGSGREVCRYIYSLCFGGAPFDGSENLLSRLLSQYGAVGILFALLTYIAHARQSSSVYSGKKYSHFRTRFVCMGCFITVTSLILSQCIVFSVSEVISALYIFTFIYLSKAVSDCYENEYVPSVAERYEAAGTF